jgi:phosphoglycerate dehydrogenase-like enzyme
MADTIILDPHFRNTSDLFDAGLLARMRSLANVAGGFDRQMTAKEVEAAAKDATVIVAGSWRHGDVDRFPKLKAILEVGGAFPSPDDLNYAACFARGIRVLSCAPAFAPAVAEMALGLALSAGRRIAVSDRAFRDGSEKWGHHGRIDDFLLFGKQVGFVGYGSIARKLQLLLTPFGCQIRVYDPWLTDGYLRTCGVEPATIEDMLRESKVTFVLATPSSANRALLDKARLEMIPRGGVLVLVSRAHLVDFDALTDLVAQGRFIAAVDVFPEEPLPADHPIRSAAQAILTPHRAGGGPETYQILGRMVVNDLEAILTGREPREMQRAQPEYILIRG